MTKLDKWSTRILNDRIDSMLYVKMALSKKPDELISYEIQKLRDGVVTPNMTLKDPYVLDFLELNDRYLEKNLDKSDIHVAKYLTILPPKEEFEQRLHKVILNAKLKYQK